MFNQTIQPKRSLSLIQLNISHTAYAHASFGEEIFSECACAPRKTLRSATSPAITHTRARTHCANEVLTNAFDIVDNQCKHCTIFQ